MTISIWIRALTIALLCAAPVMAQAQEVRVYFTVSPRADSPIEDAAYKPVGFLVAATHYVSDKWFGPTVEVGYFGGGLRSEMYDFEGALRAFTVHGGLRLRAPGSKKWLVQPSVHLMGGVAFYRAKVDVWEQVVPIVVGTAELRPPSANPIAFTFATGFALDFDIGPGKAIGARWDAIGANPNGDTLIWRLALGAVFEF